MCSPSRFLRDIDPRYLEVSASAYDTPRQVGGGYGQPRPAEPTPIASVTNRMQPAASPRLKRIETAMKSPVLEKKPVPGLAYQVGDRVRHDRFGEGLVVAVEGEGGNLKAIVDFDNLGRKQLLLKFAKLSRV